MADVCAMAVNGNAASRHASNKRELRGVGDADDLKMPIME
jgi:hypothetical protein